MQKTSLTYRDSYREPAAILSPLTRGTLGSVSVSRHPEIRRFKIRIPTKERARPDCDRGRRAMPLLLCRDSLIIRPFMYFNAFRAVISIVVKPTALSSGQKSGRASVTFCAGNRDLPFIAPPVRISRDLAYAPESSCIILYNVEG